MVICREKNGAETNSFLCCLFRNKNKLYSIEKQKFVISMKIGRLLVPKTIGTQDDWNSEGTIGTSYTLVGVPIVQYQSS